MRSASMAECVFHLKRSHEKIHMAIEIREGGLNDSRVIQLLTTHVTKARQQTAAGSAHALDLSGLRSPDIRFWTAWDNVLLGMVALKRLSSSHGEVKSMHTAEHARRKGVGSALLSYLIQAAKEQRITRLSLETGSWEYFLPARQFYLKHGFGLCGPFADYASNPNSVFMSLEIAHGSDL